MIYNEKQFKSLTLYWLLEFERKHKAAGTMSPKLENYVGLRRATVQGTSFTPRPIPVDQKPKAVEAELPKKVNTSGQESSTQKISFTTRDNKVLSGIPEKVTVDKRDGKTYYWLRHDGKLYAKQQDKVKFL